MRIILKRLVREIALEGVGDIQLAQNRVHWWAFVNTVMNLWVPQKARNLSDWVLAS
jgi:hypothetical protein